MFYLHKWNIIIFKYISKSEATHKSIANYSLFIFIQTWITILVLRIGLLPGFMVFTHYLMAILVTPSCYHHDTYNFQVLP